MSKKKAAVQRVRVMMMLMGLLETYLYIGSD